MNQLRPHHEAAVADFAGPTAAWWRAEQVHGNEVAVVPGSPQIIAPDGLPVVPGVDGLVTAEPGVVLAIYVADCGAIWLADRKTGAIGLLHSGKKGTEGNIFEKRSGHDGGATSAPARKTSLPCWAPASGRRITRWISPRRSAARPTRAGVGNFIDCGLNTASDPAAVLQLPQGTGQNRPHDGPDRPRFPAMSTFTLQAPAKLNLSLRVLGKRDDGFHEIDTLMVKLPGLGGSSSSFAKPRSFHSTATIPACPADEAKSRRQSGAGLRSRGRNRLQILDFAQKTHPPRCRTRRRQQRCGDHLAGTGPTA